MKPFPHAPAGVVPVVAVPVEDEAERIAARLHVLCARRDAPAHRVLLFVDDTTDGTSALVRGLLPSPPVPVHVVEHRSRPVPVGPAWPGARRCNAPPTWPARAACR